MNSLQMAWIRRLLRLVWVLATIGCGPPRTEIDVNIVTHGGLDATITGFQVTLHLNGKAARQPYSMDATNTFVVRLEPGDVGMLQVSVDGLGNDGCLIAQGQAQSLDVQEGGIYQMTIDLLPLAEKACRLVWKLTGSGQKNEVGLDKAGISCDQPSANCQIYRPGTDVTLNATWDMDTDFLGWTGPCTISLDGTTCTVTIGNVPTNVEARFRQHWECSPDRWCRDLGYSSTSLFGLWGSGSQDVWAVGTVGTILHWDGGSWTQMPSPTTNTLHAVWGFGRDDVWAAGDKGIILHWNGIEWTLVPSSTTCNLFSVSGSNFDDLWAVGDQGTIVHWDGKTWMKSPSDITTSLYGVWGQITNDVWAVGAGGILHWDGIQWKSSKIPIIFYELYDVWGVAQNDVWAVGAVGTILHWDGIAWKVPTPPPPSLPNLNMLWGTASNDVWGAGGDKGTIVHWDGKSWTSANAPTSRGFRGIWGAGPSDIWAISDGGTIFHWDGTNWTQLAGLSPAVLFGVQGISSDNVWAVGDGDILHWTGSTWTSANLASNIGAFGGTGYPTGPGIFAVWGSSAADVWAMGSKTSPSGPILLHWLGEQWSLYVPPPPPPPYIPLPSAVLHSAWGSKADNIWAVGDNGTIGYYNGNTWISDPKSGTLTTQPLYGVWGDVSLGVWAVGDRGTILQRNSMGWAVDRQSGAVTSKLNGVWGISDQDVWAVWAVGDSGTILQRSSITGQWTVMPSLVTNDLYGVWGTSLSDVWTVGAGPTILHWNGTSWRPEVPTAEIQGALRGVGGGTGGDRSPDVWAVGDNGNILAHRPIMP